jgi:hypothetical protein
MEILGWIIFLLPFLVVYRLIRSSQAARNRSRYNPNEYQTSESGVPGP